MTNNITNIEQHALHDNKISLATESPFSHRPLTDPVSLTETSSKAFNVQYALNPLVAAASPVLVLIGKMQAQPNLKDAVNLYKSLGHEIKTFEEKARQQEYRSAIILAGRYFLCAFVDEIMLNSDQQTQSLWQQHPLLKTVQGESYGGERFYNILERASDDPKSHIDLLELGYLCLNLGFRGKYQAPNSNLRELDNIKDNLFILINKIRGNYPSHLFVGSKEGAGTSIIVQKPPRHWLHFSIAGIILLTGLCVEYIPYHMHLKQSIQPIQILLDKIDKDAGAT